MLEEEEKTDLVISPLVGELILEISHIGYVTFLQNYIPGFGLSSKSWMMAFELYGIFIIDELTERAKGLLQSSELPDDWTKDDLTILKLVVPKVRLILEKRALHGPPYTPNLECGVPLLCPAFVSYLFEHMETIKPALSLVSSVLLLFVRDITQIINFR